MAYRYEFTGAAAKGLFKLGRHKARLLHRIITEDVPATLSDPLAAGSPKHGR